MAWQRDTLATLIQRTQADIESEIDGVDAKVRRRNLNIIAKLVALVAHTLYGFIAYVAKQIFPSTSESEYLDRHASFWLAGGRKQALYASGTVTFTGSVGAVIPEGTTLMRSDGIEYITDEAGVFVAPTLELEVSALLPGLIGNADANTTLTLASPIDGVSSAASVVTMLGGDDTEDDATLNARIESRVQEPPHGGNKTDYEQWAKEVPGVTRAWCSPKEMGDGTVTVRFVRDDDASIIPDSAEVLAVQNYIDTVAPVTATAYVVAPLPQAVNFTIDLTPDTPEVRAAVIAQLEDLIKRNAEPAGTLRISHIREAISLSAGEQNYVMTVPAADIVSATGYMSVMGAVTWL